MEHAPATPDQLMQLLEKLGISTQTRKHEAFFTVEDGVEFKKSIPGGHTKNLFVKDKKGNFFLIVAEDQAKIPMNRIHPLIGARSRLSFANADALMQYLGITPGSVTAFAVMNDRECKVQVIIDEPLLDSDLINCHPLTNTMTTTISRQDLLRFLEQVDHKPMIVALSNNKDMAGQAGEK
ncbi:MAG: prolyl-tRNA synthetase associated domain-containing protein [Rhizobiaceae bacterium]